MGKVFQHSEERTSQELREETIKQRMPVPNRTDTPNPRAYEEST
jgi:hypothetical protein